jgi:O-antigen/teichoic acid export membrane protein
MTAAAATASAPVDRPLAPRRAARDGLVVALGGQVERGLGIATALILRWGLEPTRLGVLSGLRVALDQTNKSSLGVGLGAVQEIPLLRAAGRHEEAQHVADVACTANTITCTLYALGLLAAAAWGASRGGSDPLASEWTLGLAAVAGLALVQRRLSFHVAVLRAHGEFALTTELDVAEAVATVGLTAAGVALAGFWGALASVGAVLLFKLGYLHRRHPLRFAWAWDGRLVWRLMATGLPIFATTAAAGLLASVDRVLVLWLLPDGARAAGLYSVALLGAGWGLDLAGRVGTVLHPHFRATLGRTGDAGLVLRQAAVAAEALAPVLAACAAVAAVAGPPVLGAVLPRYAEGLPALPPLAFGTAFLGLTWPARQALVAVGRPYRLGAATLCGAAVAALGAALGAARGGLAGLASGVAVGYAAAWLATEWVALRGALGRAELIRHLGRVLAPLAWCGAAALAMAPGPGCDALGLGLRLAGLGGLILPWAWGLRRAWRRAGAGESEEGTPCAISPSSAC